MTALLAATGLARSFGPTQALRDASIYIGTGEIVAIMGPSGSGKSTMLHCIAGILLPDTGSVLYAGNDVTRMSDGERSALRRREFGFVFQFGQLVPELSCIENVTLPLQLSGMTKKEARALAYRQLEALQVADLADKRPSEVSGGQGQRVALARALAPRPKIIFADEPTGALDSLSGELVMNLLTKAARESDTAIVLVTHEPHISAYADREVVVRDGRSLEPTATALADSSLDRP